MKQKKAKSNVVLAPYVARLNFAKHHRGRIADAIVAAYKDVDGYRFKAQPPKLPANVVLAVTAGGLGDSIVLSNIASYSVDVGQRKYVWGPGQRFLQLFEKHVPHFVYPGDRTWMVDGQHLIVGYNCGNGHIIQRWQRILGLPVQSLVHGCLTVPHAVFKDRVIMHFEPNIIHAWQQRELGLHQTPRELDVKSRVVIEQFVHDNPQLEFIEVGLTSRNLRKVRFVPTPDISSLVELVATGGWFVGVLSGPLHIAAAFGIRTVCILNFPTAPQIVLPVLRASGCVEEEWMYPQNVHLHMESESTLVPKLTVQSLTAAFGGDIYPFWSNDWLDLVHEDKYTI